MTTRNMLLMIGCSLMLAAALGGLVPMSAEGSSCGTAFIATDEANVDDWTSVLTGESAGAKAACDSLRSVVLIPIVMVAALGAVPLIAGWPMSRRPAQQPPSSETS